MTRDIDLVVKWEGARKRKIKSSQHFLHFVVLKPYEKSYVYLFRKGRLGVPKIRFETLTVSSFDFLLKPKQTTRFFHL